MGAALALGVLVDAAGRTRDMPLSRAERLLQGRAAGRYVAAVGTCFLRFPQAHLVGHWVCLKGRHPPCQGVAGPKGGGSGGLTAVTAVLSSPCSRLAAPGAPVAPELPPGPTDALLPWLRTSLFPGPLGFLYLLSASRPGRVGMLKRFQNRT